METTTKTNSFKAVDFMRQVRAELSELYQADKARFQNELKQAAADFVARRTKRAHNMGLAQAGVTNKG